MMKVEVCLEASEFIRFGMFDTFRHRKSWVRPALFAAILAGSAAVCFALHERRGAALLGTVLLVVALGLPAAWFLSFFLSLRRQSAGLAGGKYVYTLELHDDERGIAVDNGNERADYPWGQVFRVYRRESASYLYITPQRAFLIPHGCVRGGEDSLWGLVGRWVPVERQTGRQHHFE
ncbi:MAG: YcxB family protein [Oscillospiraceae bacterium]